jgi:hypothetical protein
MRYAPDRAGGFDLAASLKACPVCLGDLVPRTEAAGSYFVCIQCQIRIEGLGSPGRVSVPPLVPALEVRAASPVRPAYEGLPFML